MPAWNDLLGEINLVETPHDRVRRKYLKEISEHTERNTIIYYSGWMQKAASEDIEIGISDEDKNGFMSTIHKLDRSKGLDLFLHTPGGNFAATESIVRYLRSMFGTDIRAIIPQQAMSGGTIMALSCNSIILGKSSSMGPIDPQLNGMAINGILEELIQIKKEVVDNPNMAPLWQPILQKYPPGFIVECKNIIEWSKNITTEFLQTNMFLNRTVEEINGVVEHLTEKSIVKTHGRQIALEEAKDIFGECNIITLEDNQELQDLVLTIHHATMITLQQTPAYKLIENQDGAAYIKMR